MNNGSGHQQVLSAAARRHIQGEGIQRREYACFGIGTGTGLGRRHGGIHACTHNNKTEYVVTHANEHAKSLGIVGNNIGIGNNSSKGWEM